MAYGMEATEGCDILCVGEMGIGNTTIAAAICHGLFGGEAQDWVGPGTGVDAEGLKRKADAVRRAVALHKAHLGDPLEVLRRLGGREIAPMKGALLAARMQRIPVILDGYVATAAAAVLYALRPDALDHCVAGHLSAEPEHRRLLDAALARDATTARDLLRGPIEGCVTQVLATGGLDPFGAEAPPARARRRATGPD